MADNDYKFTNESVSVVYAMLSDLLDNIGEQTVIKMRESNGVQEDNGVYRAKTPSMDITNKAILESLRIELKKRLNDK